MIVGCAGELVADFFTGLPENIRKHIGTWSTIVLILALTVGLKCLIKTNELSGNVIGSLGDKAAQADKNANTAVFDSSKALSQATDALTRAGKAEESLGKAENEASSARTAASNALILARAAHQETDLFKKEIGEAKDQLARLRTPRSLTHDGSKYLGLIQSLVPFQGTEYEFDGVFEDEESAKLLVEIDDALRAAHWHRVTAKHRFPSVNVPLPDGEQLEVPASMSVGVHVEVDSLETQIESVPQEKWSPLLKSAVALNVDLFATIFPPDESRERRVRVTTGTSTVVRITVGRKP